MLVNATTCRTIEPKGSYFCNRRNRIIHVPKTHKAIACQGCEFSLHLPIGLDRELEARRIRHLKDCHYKQILLGEMTIHLTNAFENFEENISNVESLFNLRRGFYLDSALKKKLPEGDYMIRH